MELLVERDPEEARQLLDPVLERMMGAVHRYEGTVNTVAYIALAHGNNALTAHEYRRVSSMRFARQRIGRASLQAIDDHLVP